MRVSFAYEDVGQQKCSGRERVNFKLVADMERESTDGQLWLSPPAVNECSHQSPGHEQYTYKVCREYLSFLAFLSKYTQSLVLIHHGV